MLRVSLGWMAMAALAGCGLGNPAAMVATPPELELPNQTKCAIAKSQARPLIVEWPSADRAGLEAKVRRGGLVAVRYEGCEMELLDQCQVPGRYTYVAVTRKNDRVRMRDSDDLYANVPLGAARLEATLEKAGELNVSMTIVGRLVAEHEGGVVPGGGDCAKATHIIEAATVGAFDFFAGADAAISAEAGVGPISGGAGAGAKRERLAQDGDEKACLAATRDDEAPPEGCGALLRVEVTPVSFGAGATTPPAATAGPPAARPPLAASCPAGTHLEPGRGCVAEPVVTQRPSVSQGRCPAGMAQIDGGTFEMGSNSGYSIERPVQSLSLQTFCLDVTEVPAAAYEICVQSGGCRARPPGDQVYGLRDGRWEHACTSTANNLGGHPINCVTASDAESYCARMGKRLPSEAEWEYAARGGAEQRLYPWGSGPPGARRLNGCGSECASLFGQLGLYGEDDGYANTAPVGGFFAGAGRWGVLDLGGNVAEWTSTDFCPFLGDTSCRDSRRVVRGGTFFSEEARTLTTSSRWPVDPRNRRVDVGFRCARSL